MQYASAVKFYDKAEAADPEGTLDGAHLLYSNRAACLLQLDRPKQVCVCVCVCVIDVLDVLDTF